MRTVSFQRWEGVPALSPTPSNKASKTLYCIGLLRKGEYKVETEAKILEYVYDRMQEAKTAEECRKIVQRAILLSKEHTFDQLRMEFGVI